MESFLKILEEHWLGILILMGIGFYIFALIICISKKYKLGIYKDEKNKNKAPYWFRIIDSALGDFKNILALFLLSGFFVVLLYAMRHAGDFKEMMEAVRNVVAVLGGIIGSIIGFYFGQVKALTDRGTEIMNQQGPPDNEPDVKPVTTPVPPVPPLEVGEEKNKT